MPAKLSDLEHLRWRAFRAGVKLAFDLDWPTDRIVATLLDEAEKIGFDPTDLQLVTNLRTQVRAGERFAPQTPDGRQAVSRILAGVPWSEIEQDLDTAMVRVETGTSPDPATAHP